MPALEPGQIIIMDNASFHKSIETELLIEKSGCLLLFLPAYSPEFNPIEHTWASLKRYIKRFRHKFDSVIETIEYIFLNIDCFYGA
ncbi:transposase [Thiotrichales bacterium HSG1]|nr:transposase [Thiotrichales bacterium HSG1]